MAEGSALATSGHARVTGLLLPIRDVFAGARIVPGAVPAKNHTSLHAAFPKELSFQGLYSWDFPRISGGTVSDGFGNHAAKKTKFWGSRTDLMGGLMTALSFRTTPSTVQPKRTFISVLQVEEVAKPMRYIHGPNAAVVVPEEHVAPGLCGQCGKKRGSF